MGSVRQPAAAGLMSTIAQGTVVRFAVTEHSLRSGLSIPAYRCGRLLPTLVPPRSVTITATGAMDQYSAFRGLATRPRTPLF